VAALILEARGLSHRYPGGESGLDGVDLGIGPGERLAILGRNGAGKSTLLLHLNGTLRPSGGDVRLDGAPAGYGRAALAAWRRRVGLVLQDPDDQLFAASVAEDVSYGPLNLGLDDAAAAARVAEALAAAGITDLAERPPHRLSFGQKKRVAIAGALAMRPDVLLLDEPLAGLDQPSARRLTGVLAALAAAGTALVFSTHDVDLAHALADRVALLEAGRLLRAGPAAEVLADRAALAQAGLEPPILLDLGVKTRAEARALIARGRAAGG